MFRNELIGNPKLLENSDIQKIGQLHLYNQDALPFFKKSIDVSAAALMSYDEDTSAQDKWMFLADRLADLPNANHLIAKDIKELYVKSFALEDSLIKRMANFHLSTYSRMMKAKIHEYFKPPVLSIFGKKAGVVVPKEIGSANELTNDIVKEIGTSYLKNFGDKPTFLSGLFHLHTNHAIARQLLKCDEKNAKDRWEYLVKIYVDLPNNRGVLAKHIRKLFVDGFSPTTSALEEVPFFSSTNDIAVVMKAMIKKRYTVAPLQLKDMNPVEGLNQMLESGKKYMGGIIVDSVMKSMISG